MLEFALEDNKLTDKLCDMCAQAINVTSFIQNDIIDRIMKIGAAFTRSDIASVLEAKKQVIVVIIAGGGVVNTEFFNTYSSILGIFDSPDVSFDSSH